MPPHMKEACNKHNLCIISPDYRLCPQIKLPSVLQDVALALVFIQTKLAPLLDGVIDPTRLGISGGSAGGWLALLGGTGLGFKESGVTVPKTLPKVIAAIYPITDLNDPFWTTPQRPVSYMNGRIIKREELAEFLDEKSPVSSSSGPSSARFSFYHYMVGLFPFSFKV